MSPSTTIRIDDNLVQDASGEIRCAHCEEVVGSRDDDVYLSKALRLVRPPVAAGPQIRGDQRLFVDREVSFRQVCCPGCGVALISEIAPDDDEEFRRKSL